MDSKSIIISAYTQPHQFEPLLPQKELDELAERSRPVIEASLRLQSALCTATTTALRELVRAMNSYYSNTIEGQGTHPLNIARALRSDFSLQPATAKRQRIALAHIEAERELEQKVASGQLHERDILRPNFLLDAHRSLYARLTESDRMTEDGRIIAPGELRTENVAVGRHQPPDHTSIPSFLARMDAVYSGVKGLDGLLYVIAAAHHRAAWVHPFGDGNGRACRLQTHCALHAVSGGLWSVNRGLARQRERYYAMLSNADMPRRGDLDGRGNLSEQTLREWCEFFIDVCADQTQFIAKMLELEGLKQRIGDLVTLRSRSQQQYREEAILPLQHVAAAGPVGRGDFLRMTGMPERSARRILSQMLQDGLLVSASDKAPVTFAFPLDALHILLPNLYPEAAAANLEA
jgi:Fic family protein